MGGGADPGLSFGPFMGGFVFGWFVKTDKTTQGEYYFGLIFVNKALLKTDEI